jgi:glucose/arabinose dehydrogenase
MNFRMRPCSMALTSLAALALACGGDGGDGTAGQTTTATDGPVTDSGNTSTSTGTTVEPPTSSSEPTTAGPTSSPTSDTDPTTTEIGTTDPTTGETGTTDDTTTGPPACPYTPVDGTPGVELQQVANGFDRPVLVVPHPSDPDRLFVVEQGGHVKILEPGQTTAPADDAAFLFVEVKNANANMIGAEAGLLGFAFHPDFPADPRVYINYNPAAVQGTGPTYVSEFSLDPNNPDRVDPASERLVYAVGQPAGNHNGGMIAFGADGYLYIGMGDGGGSGDNFGTSRDNLSPLAKFLRIDVEPDGAPDSNKACADCPMVDGFDFTVPPDNPHVNDDGYAPEIWATGLRNPWRWQFDPATDLLYSADVGQGNHEEVSVISKGGDYGWNIMEANHCFGGAPCDTSAPPNGVNGDGMVAPIAEYSHDENNRCSITGLGVYHSCEVPAWDGLYFYADYCSTEIWALHWDGNTVMDLGVVKTAGEPVIGSGSTGHGDVLVTTVVVNNFQQIEDGKVYRIVPAP